MSGAFWAGFQVGAFAMIALLLIIATAYTAGKPPAPADDDFDGGEL